LTVYDKNAASFSLAQEILAESEPSSRLNAAKIGGGGVDEEAKGYSGQLFPRRSGMLRIMMNVTKGDKIVNGVVCALPLGWTILD
jgi:hypothetical protein